MRRLCLLLIVVSLTVIMAHAAAPVTGVVTRVNGTAIDVRTGDNETAYVAVDSSTVYRKWILSKPWAQDPRANAADVKVGSRVRIDVARDNRDTAKTVWIVVGRVGFPG